jgi:octaprenyl-diphosphate synthase
MDGATLRRDLPTAAAKWGSTLSVLLGDSLFAYALELATEFDDSSICRRIARATRDVCSGEILQTQRRYDFNLALEEYFRMIEMKTAALFAAATELAAALNKQDDATVAAMRDFGLKLGTAYQIYDDCLDLVGDEKTVGKTLGTDLAKGKLTLPMLNLLSGATEAQREKLRRRLLKGEPMDTTILAGIADYEGAIEQSMGTAKGMLHTAQDHLTLLPATPYRDSLTTMIGYMEGLLDKCRGGAA